MAEGAAVMGLLFALAGPVLAENATTSTVASGSADVACVGKGGAKEGGRHAFREKRNAERKAFQEKQKAENAAFCERMKAEGKAFDERQSAKRQAFRAQQEAERNRFNERAKAAREAFGKKVEAKRKAGSGTAKPPAKDTNSGDATKAE
jgi:hypothetical protein